MLRLPGLKQATGKGTSSSYADIRGGLLTKGVPLGNRAVGWPAGEVAQIMTARAAGFSEAQIRALVQRLHEARAAAGAALLAS
jgi:prophage regulatory protein